MKARINTFINNIVFTPKPLPAGNYQAILKLDTGPSYRLHLRIDEKGTGILILNASTILHLNPTAVEFAYHLIKQTPLEMVIGEVMKRYQVTTEVAQQDFEDFKERLETLVKTPDLDPETFLDMERVAINDENVTAPMRLDCALTYAVTDESAAVYAPVERVKQVLGTEEWKQILKNSWDAGIPHVVFTGGEPTLRPDVAELIKFTEELGQVCGLITDGHKLSSAEYLKEILQAGLDHLMIVLNPDNEESWKSIQSVIREDIFLTVHLTVTSANKNQFNSILQRLSGLEVKSLSISAHSEEIWKILPQFTQKAVENGFSLVWDLPVPYSSLNPIALELEQGEIRSEGAGSAWLYVEPDGDVLSGQGKEAVLGNFLNDPWQRIWAQAKIARHG